MKLRLGVIGAVLAATIAWLPAEASPRRQAQEPVQGPARSTALQAPGLLGRPVRSIEVTIMGPVAGTLGSALPTALPAALPGLLEPARAAVALRVGQPYSIDAVRDSLQNIHALQLTADIVVEARPDRDGVAVVFRLEPLLRLWNVRFTGDLPLRRSELRRSLSVREGDAIDERVAEAQAARVQQALSDQGYLLSEVEGTVEPIGEGTRATLQLRVTAHSRTRMADLRLEGPHELDPGTIRQTLGLTPGQPYEPAGLEAGLESLAALYVDRHYFFHRVEVLEQALDLNANTMSLAVAIDAGPRVDLSIRGLDVAESRLRELLTIFEFGSVADWSLKESRHQLVRYLQDRGHWRPLVSYSRQRDEQGRNTTVQIRALPGEKRSLSRVQFEILPIEGAAMEGPAIDGDTLRELIRTGDRGLLGGARFRTEYWLEDQRAVETAFHRQGFRRARVVEAPVELIDGDLVARMVIDQGPRTLLADVELAIESGGEPTPGIALPLWSRGLEQRSGGPYDPGATRRDADRLRALMANAGYPRGVVESETLTGDDGIRVHHRLMPGERTRVTRVVIVGNEATDDEVIARELGFIVGSPFSFADVLETQSRLYRLGIFDEVDIETTQPDPVSSDREVVVRVHEAPPKFVSFGIGYDTEERLRGLVAVGHNNIGGRNQQVQLSTRLSTREQRVRALFREPWFLGRRIEATTGLFYSSEIEPSFDVQRYGGAFQLLLQQNRAFSHLWRLTFRDVKTFDIQIDPDLVDREDQSTRVGSLGYTILRDTRTDPIDPRDGSYNTFDIDVASRWLGSNTDFLTLFGRSFWYRSLGRGVVLALAGRAGVKIPYRDTTNVPLPERFFAGGSTSLRGFRFDSAGPIDSQGNPLGGEVLLVGNIELRVPVRASLGAVLFADIGNVFAKPDTVAMAQVRESLGFGLRYETPVGPLRVDLARLMDRREGEDRYQVFFSVGHTF